MHGGYGPGGRRSMGGGRPSRPLVQDRAKSDDGILFLIPGSRVARPRIPPPFNVDRLERPCALSRLGWPIIEQELFETASWSC